MPRARYPQLLRSAGGHTICVVQHRRHFGARFVCAWHVVFQNSVLSILATFAIICFGIWLSGRGVHEWSQKIAKVTCKYSTNHQYIHVLLPENSNTDEDEDDTSEKLGQLIERQAATEDKIEKVEDKIEKVLERQAATEDKVGEMLELMKTLHRSQLAPEPETEPEP